MRSRKPVPNPPPKAPADEPRAVLGREGEALARRWLLARGCEVEAANVRYRVGELDLVVRHERLLCFVEVRVRSSDRFGDAADSVIARKQRRIIRAAQWYLARRRPAWPGEIRLDVVAIDLRNGRPAVQWIQGAFYADGAA